MDQEIALIPQNRRILEGETEVFDDLGRRVQCALRGRFEYGFDSCRSTRRRITLGPALATDPWLEWTLSRTRRTGSDRQSECLGRIGVTATFCDA